MSEPEPQTNLAVRHEAVGSDDLLQLEAIRALTARYTINGDRARLDALASCFGPDGVLEYPGNRATGPSEIVAALSSGPRPEKLTLTRHHLTTQLIDLSPDRQAASGRSYFLVVTNSGPDHSGVYVDRFRKLDGSWLFAHRQVRIDWQSEHSLFARFTVVR